MRLKFIILCFTTVFVGVKCGLIKNLLGTVPEKAHEVTDGNIVKNVGNMVYNETKGIVEDLGDLIHLRENKNNKKIEGTETNKDVNHDDVSKSITTSTPIQATTATADRSVQPSEPNMRDVNTNPPTEITKEEKVTEAKKNDNQEESTTLSTDSSASTKEVHHNGEGEISPRIARHIQTDNETKEGLAQQETTNVDNFDEVIVMYENSKLTNFNNLSDDKIMTAYDNNGVEVVIMNDCPEGQEMIIDGSCIEIEGHTEKKYDKGVGRASFVAGCFNGFALADDGSCQEVLYD